MAIFSRLRQIFHSWNAFINQDPLQRMVSYGESVSYGRKPDRVQLRFTNEKSIIASIYTRLAVDISSLDFRHVRRDSEGRYDSDIDSGLNNCLTVEANLDQGAQAFRHDLVLSLFDEGCVAIVPVDTTINPSVSAGFDIKTMRVGKIVNWMPQHVRVNVYNEIKGIREEVTLEKKFVAIVENPFFSVMNEPNSTLQRLIRTLNHLDAVDAQSSSGKLDIIIQLPYVIKSEARRQQAQQRRSDIEFQLKGSQYGIAYTDATEKITQLNRPAENNLLKQVEYLTELLYSQLGLTKEIMNGTADEKTMKNYTNRTINPIVTAILEAMRRAFLSKTARSQNQWILAFPNPFSYVPLSEMADIADKFTRNKILTANEIRTGIGYKPSKDPDADKLNNPNMPEETQSNQAEPIRVAPAQVGRRQISSAPSE